MNFTNGSNIAEATDLVFEDAGTKIVHIELSTATEKT